MSTVITCPDVGNLVNDPSHFLNFVDRNCIPYTGFQLFLFAGGCLLWVVAYAILIWKMFREKSCEMAVVAGCSNFVWEFLWSFYVFTDMGYFLVWTYRAWFFLDIVIYLQMLRIGDKQVDNPFLKRHFVPITLFMTAAFLFLYYFFIKEGHDTLIGANSAYIAQLFVSVFCLLLLIKARTLEGFSYTLGWMRSVGTGMNTVFMLLHYKDNHFLHTMALLSLVLDAYYLWMFWRKRAALRLDPSAAWP